jgi:hypothetical protein
MLRRIVLVGAAVLCAAPAFAQTAPRQVRGVIGGFKENVLTINTSSGPLRIILAPDARVRELVKFDPAEIKPGTYLGTTAIEQADGTLRAVEIHVFPPAQAARKPGEGFRPNDYAPHATMTNATVTNITAATVAGAQGRILTLRYDGGEKRVFVAPNTPIFTYAPGTASDLVAGAHVAVSLTGNGNTADQVTVDKNLLDPRDK